MTAALSWPLQQALFAHLRNHVGLKSCFGGTVRLYDYVPHASDPHSPALPWIILGEEKILPRGDQSVSGSEHHLRLEICSDYAGYSEVKRIAAAISDSLSGSAPRLSRGRIVLISFMGAETTRTDDGIRKFSLIFSMLLDDDR